MSFRPRRFVDRTCAADWPTNLADPITPEEEIDIVVDQVPEN